MQVRSNPEPDGVWPGMLNRFFCRNRAPIGHKSLTQGLVVVKEVRADNGAQSISTNQGVTDIRASIGALDARSIAQIINGDDLPIGFQGDGLALAASIQQDGQQIIAVHHDVGIPESTEKWLAQVRRCEDLSREGLY